MLSKLVVSGTLEFPDDADRELDTELLAVWGKFVIGSEAHGVPAWLIQSGLIDGFLELRLLGCTKSLNAHIATAMLLWHYCLDHQEAA